MSPLRPVPMLFAALLCLLAPPAPAQGTSLTIGALKQDSSAPVEISSDSLTLDQAAGTAVFAGNVLIVQGAMRLSAAEVRVDYAGGDQSRIERLHATGGVTMTAGTEAAEAAEAVYSPDPGTLVLTGDVLLTQGRNAISGQTLSVDLNTGAGRMEGRVRTILETGGGAGGAP